MSEQHALRRERVPPHDLTAEEAVLGAIMLSPAAADEAIPLLKPEDFYRERHGLVFRVVRDMHARGEPTDEIAVVKELKARAELKEIGPLEVHSMVEDVPSPAAAGHYARIVAEAALYRRIIAVSAGAMQRAYDTDQDGPQGLLADLDRQLLEVVRAREGSTIVGTKELVDDALEALEARGFGEGLRTGLRDLDELLHGLQPGNMIVLAARPGVGKSSLALNIGRNVAVQERKPVLFFSLEMSRFEVGMRLLCGEAEVPWERVRADQMRPEDWTTIVTAADVLADAPMAIVDAAFLGLNEIRAAARRYKGLGLLVVDYLQLMAPPTGTRQNRQEAVAEISRGLKLLAKDLHVPVIAVSQLNRNPETRSDKRPQLSDLRESGAIEADADVVVLLHRDAADGPGKAEAIVAKHRNGPTKTVYLAFRLNLMQFADLAETGRWRSEP